MAITAIKPSLDPEITNDPNNNVRIPFKTYIIRNTAIFTCRHQEIKRDGQAVYFVETSTFWNPLKTPIMTLHSSCTTGAVQAAAKIGYWGWDCSIISGDPADTTRTTRGKPPWVKLHRISSLTTAFYFLHNEKTYLWKRTHKHEFGATKWSNKDFKLIETVEEGKGRVVAVVSWEQASWLPTKETLRDAGQVNFYEDVGEELEAMALVAVLGTCYRMRRNEGG